jgi:hypothetical protein
VKGRDPQASTEAETQGDDRKSEATEAETTTSETTEIDTAKAMTAQGGSRRTNKNERTDTE